VADVRVDQHGEAKVEHHRFDRLTLPDVGFALT
jgi:hypothetical protein